MSKSTNWVPPPNGMLFFEFADLLGTYKQVCDRVRGLPVGKYWVREDGFTHNKKEVHRVYLTDKQLYSKLEKRDVFNKTD